MSDEQLIECDGPVIDDLGTITQHIDRAEPNSWVAPGVGMYGGVQAQLESKDDAAMSATFTIVTRGKEPNRVNRFIQILEGPSGKGLRLDEYQTNPLVLYEHGFAGLSLPIGLSAPRGGEHTVKLSAKKATATCYFSKLPHAEPIYAAVSEGLLRMASIGFLYLKIMLGKEVPQSLPEGVMAGQSGCRPIDVVESMLTEWSITAIGADAGALRQSLERGKIHDVRIPPWLVQSWQPHAEQRKVSVPGATFRKVMDELGVTLEGEQARVEAACQRLATPATPATPPTAPAAGTQAAHSDPPAAPTPAPAIEPPIIDPAEFGRALQQLRPQQTIDVTQDLLVAVQSALKPLVDSVSAVQTRIDQLTGKLP